MKFDSNLAWKQATSAIAANREVLLAMAGVFFLLPGLIFALFYPMPEPAAGVEGEQALALISNYYTSALPIMIPMTIVQAIGSLAMLTLFTDRTRPTVGDAIRQGVTGLLPYILAQLLLGFAVGVVGAIFLAVVSVTGSTALMAIGVVAVLGAALVALVRASLVAPVVAVEKERNPLHALRRSWELTKGNGLRIGLFYMLVAIAFGVAITVAMALIGVLLVLVAGPETGRDIAAVFSSGMTAIMMLYFISMLAAIHRQLAGPSADAISSTFE